MNEAPHTDLQRALQITVEMLDAAAGNNWERVSQFDAERHALLHAWQAGSATAVDREVIAQLQAHNQMLMAHAEAARDAVKRQLEQHQHNHRALRTYLSASLR